jgi:hypothetical protein
VRTHARAHTHTHTHTHRERLVVLCRWRRTDVLDMVGVDDQPHSGDVVSEGLPEVLPSNLPEYE